MIDKNHLYFGKMQLHDYDKSPMDKSNRYIEWIGPMSYEQMEDEYPEYRHNSSMSKPVSNRSNVIKE